MKNLGRILAPNDPVLVEKTLQRLAEQDTWNDVFSTKLIELLDTNDDLKAQIRESAREANRHFSEAAQQLEEARAAYAAVTASIVTARWLITVLAFVLMLSVIGIIWFMWSLHPFPIYIPVLVSIILLVAPSAITRRLLHAR